MAGILTLVFALRHNISASSGCPIQHFILGHPSTRLQAATCLIFVTVLWALRSFDAHLSHHRALRPLMWLETISYSVYLAHMLVMPFMDAGGRRLGFDHEWYFVTYLVEIALAIVAGWLFYLGVERHFISPGQKQRVEVFFVSAPSIE